MNAVPLVPSFEPMHSLTARASSISTPPSAEGLVTSLTPAHTPLHSTSTPRRSVLSMKNLLPLALAPVHPTTFEEAGETEVDEPLVGCNLPELLVHDLELSSSIFISKKMTAGAPMVMLPFKKVKMVSEHNSTRAPSPASHRRRHATTRCQSLSAIEEKISATGLPVQSPDCMSEERPTYESDSNSSTVNSFGAMEPPPSIRRRDNSVITAATSLTSASLSLGSSVCKQHVLQGEQRGAETSWIDIEWGSSDSGRRTSSELAVACADHPRLSSRQQFPFQEHGPLPIPASFHHCHTQELQDDPAPSAVLSHSPQPPLKCRKEDNVWNPGRACKDGRWVSAVQVDIPRRRLSRSRRVSAANQDQSYSPKCPTSPVFKAEKSPIPPVPALPRTEEMDGRPGLAISEEIARMTKSIQAAQNQEQREENEEARDVVPKMHNTKSSLVNTVPAPLVNVQSWLENSIEPMVAKTLDENNTSHGVPLPPDVVESVRVSITCFPETMLLTSSLSIETIRAYSRKVKNPPFHFRKDSDASTSSDAPRKWNFSRVLPKRNRSTPVATLKGRHNNSLPDNLFDDGASIAISAPPPPWLPLRNIFGGNADSDYLLDALYSHIVAYNYISTLCARAPITSQPRRPSTTQSASSSRDSKEDSTDIPKKAAFLLGLHDNAPTETTRRGGSHGARNRSVTLAVLFPSRDNAGSQVAASSGGQERAEVAMRDLTVGLAKCIARLVTTMKKMNGHGVALNGGGEAVVGEGADIDPLFMRSLCETVRLSEDSC